MTDTSRMSALDLATRREQLVARSASLRAQLATDAGVLRPVFRVADRARGGMAAVRQNRGLALLGAAALAGAVLVRPRAMMGLGLRLWGGWQAFRRLRPLARSVLRQFR